MVMITMMMIKISVLLIGSSCLSNFASACSLRPPCGVVANELLLTNVTGIVHVGLSAS